jgi:hypothetical protein
LPSKSLIEFVTRLGLEANKSVFFRSTNGEYKQSPSFSKEVSDKIKIIKPDAFYSFNNHPFILFFDLVDENNKNREDEIHKQVWSFDSPPLIFVIFSTSIEIYNAFHYERSINRLKKLEISSEDKIKKFSFWNLESGQSWKWLQDNVYKKYREGINKKRVNQRLFDNIKDVRNKLESEGFTTSNANILILRLIFIRYLIDRGVSLPKNFIEGDSVIECRKSFSQLISRPKELNEFFNHLNERFNGSLFKIKSINLSISNATYLSQIFDSRVDKVTPSLFDSFYFDVFDFSIIPVEVISGIYESIIDDKTRDNDSAIYTPPFLVDYILSQTLDKGFKDNVSSEAKILDPSCGSGIFLVQSYRRMVDEEIRRTKTKLESKRLREIAEKNLFGVDLNEQALLVATFSIYIALLDYKDPKAITNFKFPDLIGRNLFAANFFDENHSYNDILKNVDFDYILGNPPWRSKKDDKDHVNYITKHNLPIGRFEISQTFLLRTRAFMSTKTRSALIVTSTAFYNISGPNKEFKDKFLNQYALEIFFDLSPVRRMIFEEKNNPAAIVFYRLFTAEVESENNLVEHYSLKSNIFLKYFQLIVIEKFDRKRILQKHFIQHAWMFKVALYGNSLDFAFITKLENIEKRLNDLIDDKTIFLGAGIHKGNKSEHKSFAPIIGKPIIENSEVSNYYTKRLGKAFVSKEESHIKSGKEKGLFEGYQILIKEQAKDESDIVISVAHENYVFKSGLFGLVSKKEQETLKQIYVFLISRLYTYFIFSTSGSWGTSTRPQIRSVEFLGFPLVNLSEKQKKKALQLYENFIHPFKQWHSKDNLGKPIVPQKVFDSVNSFVQGVYDLSDTEIDLIDYVLNVSRYQFQESKQHLFTQKIQNPNALRDYADVFLKELSQIYTEEVLYADIYFLDHFVAINFKLTVPEDDVIYDQVNFVVDCTDEREVLASISKSLSIWNLTNSNDSNENLFIQKDIKGFEQNSFYIIKPNEYRCWHRAIAWYDLAEIKEVIEKAEVELLNQEE